MIIKPLEEKKKQPSIYRILFLISLVLFGILLDKIFFKKTQEIPVILGKTQEIKLQTQDKIVKKVQESSLVNDSIKKTEQVGVAVLGEATDMMTKLTSDTGNIVSDVIYNNFTSKIVDLIDRLPKDQQDKIRKQISK